MDNVTTITTTQICQKCRTETWLSVVMYKAVTKCYEFYETVDIQCTIVSSLSWALHYAMQ